MQGSDAVIRSAGRPGPSWRPVEAGGLVVFRSRLLESIPRIGHVFSTARDANGATFDAGAGTAEANDRSVDLVRRRLCRAAGLDGQSPVVLRQVHGTAVVSLAQAAASEVEADAVAGEAGEADGVAAAVRTADCVPILLADLGGRFVAAVHAGWRGTSASIARRAVEWIVRRGGDAASLRAAIGPCVCGSCYEVSPEVAAAVAAASDVDPSALPRSARGRPRLDLAEANRRQLERAGLAPNAIDVSGRCTACSEGLLPSYRRDGAGAGRAMACIGWLS